MDQCLTLPDLLPCCLPTLPDLLPFWQRSPVRAHTVALTQSATALTWVYTAGKFGSTQLGAPVLTMPTCTTGILGPVPVLRTRGPPTDSQVK